MNYWSNAVINWIKINLNEGPFTAMCGISPKYKYRNDLLPMVNCRSWGKQFSRIHMDLNFFINIHMREIEVHTLGRDYNFHIRF